ncbi:hypothetical protein D3C73_1290090 [compost metagenome]
MAHAIVSRNLLADKTNVIERGGIFPFYLAVHWIKLSAGDQQADLAVLQDPGAFFPQQAGVNRYHHGANFCQPKPAKNELRAVIQM